jgi:PAS domain S-box-containing protein
VTVGVPQSFPPYYGLDEDGNPVGFAVEVMDAVAERAGFEVSYRIVKTGGDNFEALLAGRIDIIPSLGISEKRARHVSFTAPVETFHVSLFVRDDTQDVRELNDLAGRKVAVIADNVAGHLLAPRDDIALRVFPLFTDALFALLAGRVDALAYPEPVAWKLAREARVADQLKVVGRPLFDIKRAMAVHKDNVELLALLDLAVAEFVASPDYRRIYVAWFGEPSPFWTLTRAAWAMGIVFVLSLIAMAGWRYCTIVGLNRTLKDTIIERRRVEEALRESEEKFRTVVDNSPTKIHIKDLEGRYLLVNKEAEDLFGVTDEDAKGRTSLEIFSKEQAEAFRRHDAAVLEANHAIEAEEEWVRDDGVHTFLTVKFPIRDASGKPVAIGAIGTDITERKRAQEALRESEDRFKRLVETTNVIPWEADLSTWRFTYVGPQAFALLGYPLDDWYGVGFWPNSIHPDDRDEAVAFCQASSARGEDHDFEYRMLTADGGVVWMRDVVTVVSDEHGPKALRGIMIDITEHKQAEDALRESEARYQAVVEDQTELISRHTPDGSRTFVNEAYCRFHGKSRDELIGHSAYEALAPEDLDRLKALYARLTPEQPIGEFEVSFPGPDGETIWQHWTKRAIFDASGCVTEYQAVGRDITERKRAEEALQESEQRLQRSVLDAPIPIMIHAEDGEVLMINQEWISLTGYTHAEIPTISVWTELAYGSRGITDQSRERIGNLYDIEEKKDEGEYHITTKSGEHRIWDFRSSPLGKLPDGRRFVISRAMDVTERRMAHDQLERRVEERTAELRAAQADLLRQGRLATLGQLTATVSHELRNPLGVIRTSTFVARDGLNGATARVQRALERIDRSVIRCDRIIDELLDFTRISGLEPEPTPIDVWLDGTLKEQALPAEITLRRDFGLAGTTVPIDRDRFRRAIINVFDNACQAMTGEVGREASDTDNSVLSVTTQRTNGRVEVIFEDRGPGIPADVMPKIFEPLFSTKGFGVGLGLPVVKQIMEQHGGGIEIDGAGASGTRVCLWLPAERPTR